MKAEFFNVWRDILVPEGLMNRITALCDLLGDEDSPAGRAARFIRHEINIGLLPYPNWHDANDPADKGHPTQGKEYLCTDEDGDMYIAEYYGEDFDGVGLWYRVGFGGLIQVHPTYWCVLPHTPYDDLRDPLRDTRYE